MVSTRGQRQLDPLEPAGFQLALEAHAAVLHFDLHDDGGVRQAEQFRQQHAGLAEAVIVALQAGQDQIELFLFDGGGERLGRAERIEQIKFVVGDVDAAVGALGQRFLDGLLGALGAHGNRDHFAAVLFLEAQAFFEGETVRLIHLEADIGFANPVAGIGDAQRGVFGGNLLDGDGDLHRSDLRARSVFISFRRRHRSSA